MANAFVICPAASADAVKQQASSKGLTLKMLVCKNKEVCLFYTTAKYFEDGGSLVDTVVITTQQNNFEEEVERLTGGKDK